MSYDKVEILEVKDEKGKSEFRLIVNGTHVIGTSKTDFDARFHMHAINYAIDAAYEAGRKSFAKQVGAVGPVFKTEFCLHCGAGVGEFRREGEGTCPSCDPEGCAAHAKKLQESGGICKLCGGFTTYTRQNTHGKCMKCEIDLENRDPK